MTYSEMNNVNPDSIVPSKLVTIENSLILKPANAPNGKIPITVQLTKQECTCILEQNKIHKQIFFINQLRQYAQDKNLKLNVVEQKNIE